MAITPKMVFSDQQQIKVIPRGIENVVALANTSGRQIVHCRDGYDRTLEEETLPLLLKEVSDEDQRDMWIDTSLIPSDDDEMLADDLFGDDYPRGPVVELGMLHRNGTIYGIRQQPFSLHEFTNSKTRRPFRHAIFRQECENGKGDTWPSVVFESQPYVIFRLYSVCKLLDWLRGKSVSFRRIKLTNSDGLSAQHIKTLSTSRGRTLHCIALTTFGKVYHWRRDDEAAGSSHMSSLEYAVSMPRLHDTELQYQTKEDPSEAGYLDMPPVENVALGLRMGAAVTRTGLLYVFSLWPSTAKGLYTSHIADLDDGTLQHNIPGPFLPKLASINGDGVRFVDVAAGDDHLVALTSEGKVFTVGGGFQGALGIGEKQFKLDDVDPKSFEWSHDVIQFAEDWQEVSLPDLSEDKKIVKVAAGYESTILVAGPAEPK